MNVFHFIIYYNNRSKMMLDPEVGLTNGCCHVVAAGMDEAEAGNRADRWIVEQGYDPTTRTLVSCGMALAIKVNGRMRTGCSIKAP